MKLICSSDKFWAQPVKQYDVGSAVRRHLAAVGDTSGLLEDLQEQLKVTHDFLARLTVLLHDKDVLDAIDVASLLPGWEVKTR